MVSNVSYSKNFLRLVAVLSDEELYKIRVFLSAVTNKRIFELPGRNKPSLGVSHRHANRSRLIQYATENHLWHYHTGHVNYRKTNSFGDWTSSHVLHYQNLKAEIKLVHYDSHPPFILPVKSLLL